MVRLLAGLTDTRVVRTPAFDDLASAAAFIVPRAEVLVVQGEPGVGKTVLTDDFAEHAALPVTTIDLPPRQSSRDIVRALHHAIVVGDDDGLLPERDLQDDLITALTEPRIVIVRNVQRLSAEAAGQIEWLHSHCDTAWSLILEGGPGTANAIERDALLRGRVARTVTVPTLAGSELLKALHGMHDLFLGAATDLLIEIDNRVCRGVLRNWGRFLQTALHLQTIATSNGKAAPVLDRTLAKAVLASLPSTIAQKRSAR